MQAFESLRRSLSEWRRDPSHKHGLLLVQAWVAIRNHPAAISYARSMLPESEWRALSLPSGMQAILYMDIWRMLEIPGPALIAAVRVYLGDLRRGDFRRASQSFLGKRGWVYQTWPISPCAPLMLPNPLLQVFSTSEEIPSEAWLLLEEMHCDDLKLNGWLTVALLDCQKRYREAGCPQQAEAVSLMATLVAMGPSQWSQLTDE